MQINDERIEHILMHRCPWSDNDVIRVRLYKERSLTPLS